ncbi:MAG: hypothetical protein Kow00124_31080 [Anaerolineae bacterium]
MRLTDLLARHGDAVISSPEAATELVSRAAEAAPALLDLMDLAQRLGETLTPVEPRPGYLASLKADLWRVHTAYLDNEPEVRVADAVRRPIKVHPLAIAAVATSVVGSVVAVVAIVSRRRRPVPAAGTPISAI